MAERKEEGETLVSVEGDEWMSPRQWVRGITVLSAITQAVFGLIAFVFTLTQTTQISAYYYMITFTAFMGAFWLALFLTAAIKWRELIDFRWTIWSFMAWFTFGYAALVVWFWHYRHHNSTNSTPVPLTVPFMTYLCANIFMVFFSIGYVTSAWSVWTMTPDVGARSQPMRTLPIAWDNTKRAFLAMGFIMYIAALLEGIWGWLFVQGYDMGPIYVPLIFFCVYSALNVVVSIMYWVIIWRESVARKASTAGALLSFFEGNWNELAQAIIFQAFFWVINFGFWVNLWRISGAEWTEWPEWNIAAMPVEYWSVLANSIFNSIFIPMVCYYWVTFMCSASDIVESAPGPQAYLRVGASNIFGYGSVEPVTQMEGQQAVAHESEWRAARWVIFIFFWAFLLYQALSAGFLLNELLQNTYLAMHFYTWYIFADVWLSLVFVVYLVYAAVTWVYGSEEGAAGRALPVMTVKNPVSACTFGRPLLGLFFIAFLTMFSYSKVYSRYHNPSKDIVGTQDPLLHTNSIYYGTLLTILGYLYASVFLVCKDILMGVAGTMFKIDTGVVKVVPAIFDVASDATGSMYKRSHDKTQRELS